uniref:S1 n=1 Tax=anatid alphaherpesvirus 1 TaxID=104388 RepID=E7D240_9ALPH|nr:S1 [Anatid alphaherpesvirus 1]ADU04082.1 S1 [Anatid alphaherpesvirus 1]
MHERLNCLNDGTNLYAKLVFLPVSTPGGGRYPRPLNWANIFTIGHEKSTDLACRITSQAPRSKYSETYNFAFFFFIFINRYTRSHVRLYDVG